MKQNIEREAAAIPTVMSCFSLAVPTEISPVKEGISNHNYLAKTADGEYIVKFLIHQDVEDVENDVAVQNQLRQGSITTPVYLQQRDGAYLFRDGDLKAVVSRKIAGSIPRQANPPLAQEFGRMLAVFHTCVTRLPHPRDRGLMNPGVSGIPSDIFSQALPKGVIHGDFHLGNALLCPRDPNRLAAMLDFEEAGENLFLVDLAVTTMGVCFSGGDNAADPRLVQALMRGYQRIRTLTDTEKSLFPEAVQYAAEAWIKWFSEQGYQRYAEDHRGRLNRFRKCDLSQLYDLS